MRKGKREEKQKTKTKKRDHEPFLQCLVYLCNQICFQPLQTLTSPLPTYDEIHDEKKKKKL